MCCVKREAAGQTVSISLLNCQNRGRDREQYTEEGCTVSSFSDWLLGAVCKCCDCLFLMERGKERDSRKEREREGRKRERQRRRVCVLFSLTSDGTAMNPLLN